jgi:hypothetical protein
MNWLITWDRTGPLGEKGRQLVEKVGEWYVEIQHLQDYSTRLCRLRINGLASREQVLNVSIACWWYGSSKPTSLSSTEPWLNSTASLVSLGEKLGMDPCIGQSTCCGLYWEPFFSGAEGSVQIYRWLIKYCYVRWLPTGSVRQTYVD